MGRDPKKCERLSQSGRSCETSEGMPHEPERSAVALPLPAIPEVMLRQIAHFVVDQRDEEMIAA